MGWHGIAVLQLAMHRDRVVERTGGYPTLDAVLDPVIPSSSCNSRVGGERNDDRYVRWRICARLDVCAGMRSLQDLNAPLVKH